MTTHRARAGAHDYVPPMPIDVVNEEEPTNSTLEQDYEQLHKPIVIKPAVLFSLRDRLLKLIGGNWKCE